LAAEVMDIGVNRVWMNPEASKDIAAALTREDIRKLIEEGKVGKELSKESAEDVPAKSMKRANTGTGKDTAQEAAQRVLEDQRRNNG